MLAVLEVEKLSKNYGEKSVLNQVSFKVFPGEILGIIGPSGIGKSTILKLIADLEHKSAGNLIIRSKEIGMAFQYSALLNSYNVAENISLAIKDQNLSKTELRTKVLEVLKIVNMENYSKEMPDDLSGGQKKRVSFARAIANNPDLLLFDEPTAGLDPINSTILENYILKITKACNRAVVLVTHQLSTIFRATDKIICLFDGRVAWQGKTSGIRDSENLYIKQFISGAVTGPFTE